MKFDIIKLLIPEKIIFEETLTFAAHLQGLIYKLCDTTSGQSVLQKHVQMPRLFPNVCEWIQIYFDLWLYMTFIESYHAPVKNNISCLCG